MIQSLTVDTCTCVCGIYHIKIKWLVSRDTSTQYHPILVQFSTYNQTLRRDTSVFHNAPWKLVLKYNVKEQLLQRHHHSDRADDNNAGHEWAFADWTNQQFQSPSNWLPVPHSTWQAIHCVNTWVHTTDYSTCEEQWCIYCTQVPPLYISLLHTHVQPWSDNRLPPSIHWGHKAIHMTSALCAQQHQQACTEATH